MAETAKAAKPQRSKQAVRFALAEQYAASNRECARIILSSPQRYEGILAEWARLVLNRASHWEPRHEI